MKSGVFEYWIVNTEDKSILQYSFSEEREIDYPKIFRQRDTIQSTAFPDLGIALPDIFSEEFKER